MTAVPPHSESSRLRASDEDRDRALDVLRAAAGDGRLTAEEFGERMEAALSARTLGDLAALTADLTAPQAREVTRIDQRLGSVRQAGRWLVPRRLDLRASLCLGPAPPTSLHFPHVRRGWRQRDSQSDDEYS